jgi:hypothetical protein
MSLDRADNDDTSLHDCTDVESTFFENEPVTSSQSPGSDFHSSALSELVGLLYNSDLKPLYTTAVSKVGPEKFARNFRHFLLRYSRKLQHEASNPLELQAAKLVRVSARQIAVEIEESVAHATDKSRIKRSDGKDTVRLNEWLGSAKGRLYEWLGSAKRQTDSKEERELSGASDSNESEMHMNPPLCALEEVKNFMISGQAFTDLCDTFRQWLNLDGKGIITSSYTQN